jgi:hypothetical protein
VTSNFRESQDLEISNYSKEPVSKKSVKILDAFDSKKESTFSNQSRKSLSLGKVLQGVDHLRKQRENSDKKNVRSRKNSN